MRILFVAMSSSIHTARWISQIAEQGWDIYIFPSITKAGIQPEIKSVSVYCSFFEILRGLRPASNVKIRRGSFLIGLRSLYSQFFTKKRYSHRPLELKWLIDKVKPDIIHTLETQHAGYLVAETRKMYAQDFPLWIHSNWGIDLHFYGQLKFHKMLIRDMLSLVDVFICEGGRDSRLAIEHGYKGEIAFNIPGGGGYDLNYFELRRKMTPTSQRKLILVKGYQNEVRRALVALRAIERCADILSGYEVVIFSASPDVVVKAELLTATTGIQTRIVPHSSQQELFELLAEARLSMTVNLSDGLPNTMLEAMLMGALPVQSWTSCADEWIENGVNGFLVPPEDPEEIEFALRRALSDNFLVDEAANINWSIARERLERNSLKKKVVALYNNSLATFRRKS